MSSSTDKEKIQEYDRNYYKENKDRINKRNNKWSKENRGKCNELQRNFYQINKEKIRKQQKKYYYENHEKTKERQRNYRKNNPEKIKDGWKKHRERNHEKLKERDRKRNALFRLKVITHYSGGNPKCVCCGESNYQFLTLDHINNDGYIERKKGLGATSLMPYLIKNNYPSGYQVLCYNCNCGRAHTKDKICPHNKINV